MANLTYHYRGTCPEATYAGAYSNSTICRKDLWPNEVVAVTSWLQVNCKKCLQARGQVVNTEEQGFEPGIPVRSESRRCFVCGVPVARIYGPRYSLQIELLPNCQKPIGRQYRCVEHPLDAEVLAVTTEEEQEMTNQTADRFSDEAATCEECAAQEFNLKEYIADMPTIVDPGKFEGEPLATYHAYHVSLDGGCEAECGDVQEDNWCGLIGNMILWASNVGFVSSEIFTTDTEAATRFAKIEAEMNEDEEAENN